MKYLLIPLAIAASAIPAYAKTGVQATYGTSSQNPMNLGISLPLASEIPGEKKDLDGRLLFNADLDPNDPLHNLLAGGGFAVEHPVGSGGVGVSGNARVPVRQRSDPRHGELSSGVGIDFEAYGFRKIGGRLYVVAGLRQDIAPEDITSGYAGLRLNISR